MIEYGAIVSTPSDGAPLKNSSCVTDPSLSEALAVIVMFAGAVKVAPLVGELILTEGGLLPAGLTVTLTALEVAAASRFEGELLYCSDSPAEA